GLRPGVSRARSAIGAGPEAGTSVVISRWAPEQGQEVLATESRLRSVGARQSVLETCDGAGGFSDAAEWGTPQLQTARSRAFDHTFTAGESLGSISFPKLLRSMN